MEKNDTAEIQEKKLERKADDHVRLIPTEMIFPGELFARTEYDPASFKFLCGSIAKNGIIEPLIVVKYMSGYKIVSGDRRFYAAKHMKLDFLPCIVRKEASQVLELSIKMSSKSLSPFDSAEALRALGGVEAAPALSMKRQEAEALLKLLDFSLKERVVAEGAGLKIDVLTELLKVKDLKKRAKLLDKTVKGNLSPREVKHLSKQKRKIRGAADIRLIANSARKMCAEFDDMGISLDVEIQGNRVIIQKRK